MKRSMARQSVLVSRVLASVTGLVALGFLSLWIYFPEYKEFSGNSMKANTAMLLLLASLSLLCFHKAAKQSSLLLSALILVGGGLTSLEYLFGFNFHIDEILVTDVVNSQSGLFPGRMSPIAAACFVFLGSALISLYSGRRYAGYFTSLFLIPVFSLSLLSATGYLFHVTTLYQFGPYIGIAWQTAVCLFVMAFATLSTKPEQGVGAIVWSPTIGGQVARRALATAVVVPLVFGWICITAQQSMVIDQVTGTAILVVTLIVAFSLVILAGAKELVKADAARLSGELRLRLFVEQSPFAMAMLDKQMNYLFASKRWLSDFNIPLESLAGKNHYEVFPEIPERWKDIHRKCLAGATDKSDGEAFQRADGSVIWLRWEVRPWYDNSGNIGGLLISSEDITERKLAEAKLERTKENETARLAAERANKMKDDFLTVLSHELRTPLTTILGWSQQLLSKPWTSEQVTEGLKIIERSAQLQGQLVNDLLDVSRIHVGKLSIDIKPIYIIDSIRTAVKGVQQIAKQKNIEIETEVASNSIKVLADGTRLQQVFWNLLTNALKFTPNGGRINVKVDIIDNGKIVQVTVKDTGKGITAEFLPHIFDRFSQQDSSSIRQHGGLGLGLTLVKNLVEMQHGTVKAESEGENRGSKFTVNLPIVATAVITPEVRPKSQFQSNQLSGVRVLIVDDDLSNLELFKTVVSDVGAKVCVADSADRGYRLLQTFKPDVLVSDISMPGEDGYSFIGRIRKLDEMSGGKTPAVALTAYTGAEDFRKIIASGFTAHVSKPIDRSTLIATIAGLVKAPGETFCLNSGQIV